MAPLALNLQVDALRSLPNLAELPTNEATILARIGVFRAFAAGDTIPIARLRSSQCYVILSGVADTVILDRDGEPISIGELGEGDFFGNSIFFSSHSLLYAVQAQTQIFALQWSIERLHEKKQHLPLFMHLLEASYLQRRAVSALSRVPLFSHVSVEERALLATQLTRQEFGRNTVIFEQGSAGQALYLIEQGQIAVEQHGVIVATLSDGDFFGEMALLSATPHNATLRCLTPTRCLHLPGAVFAAQVAQHPSLEAAVRRVIDERVHHSERVRGDQTRQHLIKVAVRYGMFRGSHVLVRQPAQCPPDCRICEQACAERFGQTRMRLNGAKIEDWDITQSCRQCRVGAECVEACPEAAIQWDDNGALRITDACTGCNECVVACPYDAVESQTIFLQNQQGPLWQLWQRMRQQSHQIQPKTVASKCDLCAGYDDRACLSQCPTGSLQLISIEELFPF
ncbi:MAG: cyclic nucleotide-binding domain-containing protein [Chloroflexi bacterium]|nr:cyclic nucleotide-binding domain-containing protein [Chloroflexota bacterium]